MMQRSYLLECVRERIVTDVVKERGRPHDRLFFFADRNRIGRLAEERQRPPREVMGAERVLESGVGCARVDEVRPTELADVPQALKDVGVDELERQLVDSNVVPDGVA